MDNLLYTYMWFGAISLMIGIMLLLHREDPQGVRVGARLALAAPVWPLVLAVILVWALYKLVRWLIRGIRTLFLIAFNKHPDWRKYTYDK